MKSEYSQLIYKAFRITKNHKILWFFGFLWVGFSTLLGIVKALNLNVDEIIKFCLEHDWILVISSKRNLVLLLAGLFFLLLANILAIYTRVVFVFLIAKYLNKREYESLEENVKLKRHRQGFVSILRVSLITGMLMLFVVGVLALTVWVISYSPKAITQLLPTAGLVFVVSNFIFSSLNFFGVFYSVWYGFPVREGLSIAVDLLKKRWVDLIILFSITSAMQFILYSFCMLVIYLIDTLVLSRSLSVYLWSVLGIPSRLIEIIITVIIFWISGSLYSVFFNTLFALYFFEQNVEIQNYKELEYNKLREASVATDGLV